MVIYYVCYDTSVPQAEQEEQQEHWMNFLGSALPLPQSPSQSPNWTIIPVGLQADRQTRFNTGAHSLPSSWKAKWPSLPLSDELFIVSSLKSRESVQILLRKLEVESSRIFQSHATSIPTSYRTLLGELQSLPASKSLISLSELFRHHSLGMSEQEFERAIQYLHAIGRIIWLKGSQIVCADPTIVPKLAAKFVAPEGVCMKVHYFNKPIMAIDDVGYLLDIAVDDKR